MFYPDSQSSLNKPSRGITRFRVGLILGLILVIAAAHWCTPVTTHWSHGIHVALRKSFVIPIVLGAAWFDLSGALLVALAVTAVFLPHVLIQWSGEAAENVNQFGELFTIWATALVTGWLFQQEKEALLRISQMHEGSLFALVKALDAREHDTKAHSIRVRALASRIGEEMNLDSAHQEQLRQGALLHDIGKIGVPDDILLRKGPLTEQEIELMRKHPEVGFNILKSVPFTEDAAQIVLNHHEKFDGSGYPAGLRGMNIPLGARIFALADAFDALTSERPYQAAVPIKDAIKRLCADSGSHFDPEVMTAFRAVSVEEWVAILDSTNMKEEEIEAP